MMLQYRNYELQHRVAAYECNISDTMVRACCNHHTVASSVHKVHADAARRTTGDRRALLAAP